MKVHLKVSVKIRGGRICIPGVYDLEKDASLAAVLEGVENEAIFVPLDVPAVIEEEEIPEEETEEEDSEEETEEEETEEEEVEEEEAPKKKAGRPKKKGK